jgi:endoglucanase
MLIRFSNVYRTDTELRSIYFSASDYVKFVWTQAASSTLIAWGLATAPDGYERAGLLKRGLECLRWASDFLIKCHVKPNELYGQVISSYQI